MNTSREDVCQTNVRYWLIAYNICPTDIIDAVIDRGGKRDLVSMRWGLIPDWWRKSANEMPATFNARAETVGLNDYLQAWPVSKRVNSSRAPSDDPTLIEQITK